MGKDFSSHAYDKAKWHYGGEFPEDTPEENAFTFTGFFLTWLLQNDLLSDEIRADSAETIEKTRDRDVSPIALYEEWDGCLIGDMLSEKGNAFAFPYYEKHFYSDFGAAFEPFGLDVYDVTPNWENYDKFKPVLDARYEKWRSKKWWQVCGGKALKKLLHALPV